MMFMREMRFSPFGDATDRGDRLPLPESRDANFHEHGFNAKRAGALMGEGKAFRACIHRGAEQIGGTCVELACGGARIFSTWKAAGRPGK